LHQTELPWGPAPEKKSRKRKAAASAAGSAAASREARCRAAKAQYCGEVKCIDDNVGRILDCLRERAVLDRTVVVFTTDHGEYMGEHGLYGKNQLYETAYRIPFLVRWPEKVPSGTVVDSIVSTVDVQPTLLGLMGIEPSAREQGVDASDALCAKRADLAQESFLHHSTLNRAGIFTPEYELVLIREGRHVLFDRVADPEQVDNLYSDPSKKNAVKELTARIVEHHRKVKSPALEWLS
jgi:arylsulfatase A-like enzyme